LDDKVIVLKDWVPGWVRESYLSNEEIDALNDEYYRSQLKQENVEISPGSQALLVKKAVAKLETLDRENLERWLHRIPASLLVHLIERGN
jgi:vesicle coat complex subunit